MHTAGPTTGPTHATFELRECLLDTDTPRLRFFAGRDPADPLIACKGRDVFPHRSRRRRLYEGLSQIIRHGMHHAPGDSFLGHRN